MIEYFRARNDDHRRFFEEMTIDLLVMEMDAADEHLLGEIRGLQADLREAGAHVDQQERSLRLAERRDALRELMGR